MLMRVEPIQDPERFRLLRQEWTELLGHSAADCLFLTWEWLYTWWKHLSDGRKLCLLMVQDGGGLAGLAPFVVSRWRVTRFRPFGALEFLGTGSVGSDYLDAIGRRDRERDVVEAFADYLRHRRTALELVQVNGDASLVPAVAAELAGHDWTGVATRTNVCPFINLAGHSWESYLATLGAEHRYNIRRRLRNLESRFEISVESVTTDAQRRAALAEVVMLHHRRWQGRGRSSAFSTPAVLAFHEEFSQLALERGWLRLFVLRLNGAPVSASYGFRYKKKFYFYQCGFAPEYSKHSVGLVTTALAIKNAIGEGAEEYDFLHGDESYKLHWAQYVRELRRLELYPPGLRSALCRVAVETNRAARGLARQVLPLMSVRPLVRN